MQDLPVKMRKIMRALSDRTRMEIVRSMVWGATHESEIASDLGLESSELQPHLLHLQERGIIAEDRPGTWVLDRQIKLTKTDERMCLRLEFDDPNSDEPTALELGLTRLPSNLADR